MTKPKPRAAVLQHDPPEGTCQSYIVHSFDHLCPRLPAIPFAADCECGHAIDGTACRQCLDSLNLHCLECWRQDSRHKCSLTFTSAARLSIAGGMRP